MKISEILLKWYKNNQRNLPWRKTTDPYAIWLSEILLQQTRVEQGIPYYHRFLDHFPTVQDLAEAPNDLIMRLWQGLGYYSRARNLHKTAKIICETYNGEFPSDYQLLKSLPGVGDYTAAAIASFAFNLPFAVVDGNVYRFLSRVMGYTLPVDSSAGKKYFNDVAQELLDKKLPGINNQAIMEFGAIQCKPVSPLCNSCPMIYICKAYEKNIVNELPVKEKSNKVRNRFFNYLLIRHENAIALNYRTSNDIWKHLYDFPLIETSEAVSIDAVMGHADWNAIFKGKKVHIHSVSDLKPHKLSHQKIHSRLFDLEIEGETEVNLPEKFKMVMMHDVNNYAVPRIIEKILEEKFEEYNNN